MNNIRRQSLEPSPYRTKRCLIKIFLNKDLEVELKNASLQANLVLCGPNTQTDLEFGASMTLYIIDT